MCIKCSEGGEGATLSKYTDLIMTLGSGIQVHIVTGGEGPPQGCAISTVSAKCEVHMLLKVSVVCLINLIILLMIRVFIQ